MNTSSAWAPLENLVTGDRMLVLHRGRDAEGEVLEVQFDLPPGAGGSPMHRHQQLEERFEVIDGSLQMCVDGVWSTLVPGDVVTVRPGVAHRFRNDSRSWVTFITELRPPANFERFLRTWYGLANAGETSGNGIPRNLLYLARCLQDADFTFAGAPAGLQRMLIAILVRVGMLAGAYARLMDLEAAPFGASRPAAPQ